MSNLPDNVTQADIDDHMSDPIADAIADARLPYALSVLLDYAGMENAAECAGDDARDSLPDCLDCDQVSEAQDALSDEIPSAAVALEVVREELNLPRKMPANKARLMADMVATLIQYADDLRRPPLPDSAERRQVAIAKLIERAGGVA